MPSANGALFVAVRIKNDRASTKLLKKPETIRSWCVHRIGGKTGATLTAARRANIIAKHRASLSEGGVKCAHCCANWNSKFRRIHGEAVGA